MDKRESKYHPHPIILTLDLPTLKFNGILIIDLVKIRSNGKWRFNEFRIISNARSWDEKSIQGAELIIGGAKLSSKEQDRNIVRS